MDGFMSSDNTTFAYVSLSNFAKHSLTQSFYPRNTSERPFCLEDENIY